VQRIEAVADILPRAVRQLRQPVGPNKLVNRRWFVNWLATLVTAADEIPCIVEDISAGGARLRVGLLSPQSGEAVTLVIVNYAPIAGLIAWQSRQRVGLKFNERQPFVEVLLVKAARQAVGSGIHTSNTRMGTLARL
jgi:hypothetical protein